MARRSGSIRRDQATRRFAATNVFYVTSSLWHMPSGLIFIVILAIWAVILVPRMVRRYDLHATDRTTRRFRHAMSSLGGSGRVRRRVDVMMVRRAAPAGSVSTGAIFDSAVDLHLDHGVDPFVAESVTDADSEARRFAARTAAVRRRRVVLALCLGVCGAVVLALVGVVSGWVAVVPTMMLALMVAVSRRHALQQTRWREQLRLRAEERRLRNSVDVVPLAPVVSVRRRVEDVAGTAPAQVRSIDGKQRRRSLTPAQGRLAEQYRALSATYQDAEDELGLDDYVAGDVRPDYSQQPRLRAVNE